MLRLILIIFCVLVHPLVGAADLRAQRGEQDVPRRGDARLVARRQPDEVRVGAGQRRRRRRVVVER